MNGLMPTLSPVLSPVLSPALAGNGSGAQATGLLGDPLEVWLVKNGLEGSIGLSITDKQNVRAEIWELLFDEFDEPYSDEQRITNIEASAILNNGWELTGSAVKGYAVYPEGTSGAILTKAYRYLGQVYAPYGNYWQRVDGSNIERVDGSPIEVF